VIVSLTVNANVGARVVAPVVEYNSGVVLETLRKLFRRRQALQAELKPPERTPDELKRDRDLLERVAAGMGLNKTPGR
jgi:hypothetical protein